MSEIEVLDADVIILGAGPSGSVAAALLVQKGHKVIVVEKQQFPRFSIGESLLPQAMVFLEEAGMTDAVKAASFQFKNGAAFAFGDQYTDFDFSDKFTNGPGTTYQVTRADFDHILINEAEKQGAQVLFGHQVMSVAITDQDVCVSCMTDEKEIQIRGQFVLDASGFGRVLPRLLELEKPSCFPARFSYFTHVKDNIKDPEFDRNKILISIHPQHRDIWFWLIPFSDGRSSLGVILPEAPKPDDSLKTMQSLIHDTEFMSSFLKDAEFDRPINQTQGYSADVTSLCGDRFALLGNAGEFLDPVFSSGVTIALKSASLAADVLHRQLQGEVANWQEDFVEPLQLGVRTFKKFVQSWYDTSLQSVIFAQNQNPKVRAMICSILAGYAWDVKNPYVQNPNRLQTLAQLCGG